MPRRGGRRLIVAKVNSLLDKNIIQALYRASQAGVHVELIVRGACALRPGVRGVSSRIRVRSVVGRFLEHSRIFVFGNGGDTEVYLGSADWMPRNLYERVEVIFRLKDPSLCQKVCNGDSAALFCRYGKGSVSFAHRAICAEAARRRSRAGNGTRFNVQDFFMGLAEDREGPGALLSPALLEKLQDLPMYEALAAKWVEEPAAEPDRSRADRSLNQGSSGKPPSKC